MPLRFESPTLLAAASLLCAVAIAVGWWRRPALPTLSKVLAAIGLILLSLAAGGATWRRSDRGAIAVMVDVSPSTRTATFRQRAGLDRRVRELLGDQPYTVTLFSDGNRPDPGGGGWLADVAAERTVFAPSLAPAILLFSDARFALPNDSSPTYCVIDPVLEQPADAAVRRLELRGDRQVAADVTVSGGARSLTLTGVTAATQPVRVSPGGATVVRDLAAGASGASAQFDAGDAWPENDALRIDVPPPPEAERWWVGASPPDGWRTMPSLPTDAAAYLAPSVIVLNDLPATSLSPAQSQRLQQYVRDLGGGLVILGGAHAFAAGDYVGTPLESLSPLASTPPQPATRWVVLVDGSGSMAGAADSGGGTLWQAAARAVTDLLPRLPPDDSIAVGSFAENVSWWSAGRSVKDTAAIPLPPPELTPHGPTNLQHALSEVTKDAEAGLPTQLLVLTDAEVQIENAAALAAEMKARDVHLHVLATGEGSGLPALRHLADSTGGSIASTSSAANWSARLREMSRSAMPRRLETDSLAVRFLPPLTLPPRAASPWNRTWMKSGATALAEAGQAKPAARWRVGSGEVAAAAFAATPAEAVAMADLVARRPADPRFKVRWDAGATLTVTVDAVDDGRYLNGQQLTLELSSGSTRAIPQVASGRYELSVDAPHESTVASVRAVGATVSRFALAGRYAPEFDAIGNDHAAMRELARRTGGGVVDYRQTKPIAFRWPRQDVSIVSWLSIAGAACLALALAWWRSGAL